MKLIHYPDILVFRQRFSTATNQQRYAVWLDYRAWCSSQGLTILELWAAITQP
jgi:hypothetical protein